MTGVFPVITREPEPMFRFRFLEEETESALIHDIRELLMNINYGIGSLMQQRDRVLALSNEIRRMLDKYISVTRKYDVSRMLVSTRYYIRITNRSIIGFDMEVDVLVSGYFHRIINYKT